MAFWQNFPSIQSKLNATNLNNLAGGWTKVVETLTYASADSPTFVINTASNLTNYLSVGMKLKLTQTTVKYFIITAITSSTITVYGVSGYTLTNATITDVYFSTSKSPYGFPTNLGNDIKGKTIIIRKNTTQSISATTQTQLTFQTVDAGYDSNVFDLVSNAILLKSPLIKTVGITLNYQITNNHNVITYADKNSSRQVALGRASNDSGQMISAFNATKGDSIKFSVYDVTGATTVSAAGDWNFATLTILDTY